jgi:hypothetical protein
MMHRRGIAYAVFSFGLAGLVAGCSSGNDSGGPKGSLAITMGATGAPAAGAVQTATADGGDALSHLKAAVITIAGIEARMVDRAWVPIETGLPADVDLIAIINAGNGVTLPADLHPEGDYEALELRITQVQLTLMDDTKILITPPGSGWTVQIPVNFSVVAGESTVVKLKLRCGSSFRLFDGEFEFDPEFEVEGVEHE